MTLFNLIAPCTLRTSYGLVAMNLATRLDCRIFPINNLDAGLPTKVVESAMDQSEVDLSLPTVKIYHQFDLAMMGKKKRIGYTFFELDTLSNLEIANINSCDELWVASKWAKTVCENNKINIPIYVVPLGVDLNTFNYTGQYTSGVYTFLSCGKWEIRKSQDEIVQAFNTAFEPADNVKLLISMHNPFHNSSFMDSKKQEYLSTKMGKVGKIQIVGPFNTQADLARIMKMSDCGVFPSKAEGWGLGTLEMMACGKSVIVTNYSGHTEYCDKYNSVLIEPSGIELAKDGKWFFGSGKWCKFKTEDLIEKMRLCYKLGPIVNERGIFTSKKFSWENTAETVKALL